MKKLSKTEKAVFETAKIAIGDLPKSYFDFCQTVWRVFNLGREYEKAFSVQQVAKPDQRRPCPKGRLRVAG